MPKKSSACAGKKIANALNSSATAAAGPTTQRPGPVRRVGAAVSLAVVLAADALAGVSADGEGKGAEESGVSAVTPALYPLTGDSSETVGPVRAAARRRRAW